jgi:hypothetical protein
MSKAIKWAPGDMVTWYDLMYQDEPPYIGTVRDCLSSQLLVRTRGGTDRFVSYNNPTLKPYRQGAS